MTTSEIFNFIEIEDQITIFDIGAAAINEIPIYKPILDRGLGYLYAFDGDERQIDKIKQLYGKNSSAHKEIFFDGSEQTIYFASATSGMTSLLKPKEKALNFFNNFQNFGKIEKTMKVTTTKLDDFEGSPLIDFLKMDVQGSELTILKNGTKLLAECIAIQLEISFIPLYENQPTFGEIDLWMREKGFIPHRFTHIKNWSIAPTIFNNNFRSPGNQLLEGDIIYIKDPLSTNNISIRQLKKLVYLSHYCFKSIDLCIYFILELIKRNIIKANCLDNYLNSIKN